VSPLSFRCSSVSQLAVLILSVVMTPTRPDKCVVVGLLYGKLRMSVCVLGQFFIATIIIIIIIGRPR